MRNFFQDIETNLITELTQTGKVRIQVDGFKSLYARLNSQKAGLKFELRFKHNGKSNTKTYKQSSTL